ncbi:hypothetical protein [Actinomadura madurae]|uniref:hypothetical protein n=1 Tax=Actinomadura madurae TaxID=1993 RepID=UPI0020D21102|nr:hypothetical protein [Actinomadura madurae]MCP9947235.1 hypothetical protein [Actinomadura madurae]MCP9963999.1 hypothetical protein [Actinomadura madurae]MCP9976474.1 hypothetical protein [Actinomadura madurae]MCQ0012032.1 hypothetical protein [Actinomadura madurae]MCQ0012666.1 hypothetical protein [Actinomadura madurae]
MTAVIHIAGPAIIVQPGFMRQRCSWCGAVLIDYDLGRIAVPRGQDTTPSSWAAGAFVEVDGAVSAVVPHAIGDPLPAGACALLDPEATR